MSAQIPTPLPSADPPDALARQLRLFKWLALILVLLLTAGIGLFWYQRRQGQPVVILLDGKPMAVVRNAAAAQQVLMAAEQEKIGAAYAGGIIRLQSVKLQNVASNTPIDTDDAAKSKLARSLKINVHAYVIMVNGKTSLGLPTSEMAADTLQRVKDHFEQMPPAAEVVGNAEFVEKVEIRQKVVDSSRARASADEAAPYFWTPPPSKQYIVKPGDRGSRIAARNHISLGDLFTANPGQNLNRLKPGDVLNVQKMPLLLTVRVQKTTTKEGPVITGVPASEAGLESVTYIITYINGQETHREPQNISIIEKPQPRSEI